MFLLALGVVIILIISLEMIATVTMTGGGFAAMLGPFVLSRVLQRSDGTWRVKPWPSLGMSTLVMTVFLWFVLLWAGWLCVFASDPGAVLSTATGEPANLAARIYFSGYTLSTLGVGDYSPGEGVWQVLTAVASLSGFFLLTLTISFFVPIVQAEMQRRRAALLIHHLGPTPQKLLLRCYHPEREEQMPMLRTLVTELVALEQMHRRYPITHYSGSRSVNHSLVLAIATLDEALSILKCCDATREDEYIDAARRSIQGLLMSMDAIFIRVDADVPPVPEIDELVEEGVMTMNRMELCKRFEGFAERRRRLNTFVRAGGWAWGDIEDEIEDQRAVRFFFRKVA